MPADQFIVLLGLAFTSLFTPGPNNTMLAASGVNFGYMRTLPHMLGVTLGFAIMVFVVGFFMGALFQNSHLFREILRWGGALLLLWIAYKVATSGSIGKASNPRPMRFVEAAAFQWINPKAWAMAVGIPSQFVVGDAKVQAAVIVSLVFAVMGFFSSSTWVLAGQALTRWITTANRLRVFNAVMGLLIAGFVVFMLIETA